MLCITNEDNTNIEKRKRDEKLEILKESILGNVEVKKEEKEEKIDEAVEVSKIKYDFSHLI